MNADYECVFQGYTKLSSAGKCERIYCAKTSTKENQFEDICITLLDSELMGYMWLKQFRRAIIETHRIRFDEDVKYREDFLFTIKYLSFCKEICVTEDTEYLYRVDNPDSLLHTWWDAEEFLRTNDCVYEIVKQAWMDNPKLYNYFTQWYAENQYKGIRGLIRDHNRKHMSDINELEYIKKMVTFCSSNPTKIAYSDNWVYDMLLKLIWKTSSCRLIHIFMKTTIR